MNDLVVRWSDFISEGGGFIICKPCFTCAKYVDIFYADEIKDGCVVTSNRPNIGRSHEGVGAWVSTYVPRQHKK